MMIEDIDNMPSTFNQSLFKFYMDPPEIPNPAHILDQSNNDDKFEAKMQIQNTVVEDKKNRSI